jgi:hypothetical protein
MTVLQERVDLDFTRDSWGLQMHMLNVLFAFHALRYPKQYTEKPVLTDARHHPNEVALAGRNAAGIVISREAEILLLRDEPEKVAGKIRSGAAPVLSFLRSQQPTEP